MVPPWIKKKFAEMPMALQPPKALAVSMAMLDNAKDLELSRLQCKEGRRWKRMIVQRAKKENNRKGCWSRSGC